MSTPIISYQITNVTIADMNSLERFLLTVLPSNIGIVYATYASNTVTILTKELEINSSTQTLLDDLVKNKYPNPPAGSEQGDALINIGKYKTSSTYGYLPLNASSDGNVTINGNTTIYKNMNFLNLTINSGATLYSNGWRIVVAGTLTLNGTISNDGGDAVANIGGVASSTVGSTYLGTGGNGADGLTGSGNGRSASNAIYQCSGCAGGSGGSSGLFIFGSGGLTQVINSMDGGINVLATLPTAFNGRLLNSNYYIMGGTGGGAGACNKGSATAVKSGSGGAGGGLIIIATQSIIGTGKISARGGNGSSASYTGGTAPIGLGGGGGGGGGCIVVITQLSVPPTITFDVSGGTAGNAIGSATNGIPGVAGNVYMIQL